MSKKTEGKEPKTQTNEVQEQNREQLQGQPEQDPKSEEQPKELPKEEKPMSGKKPAKESDADTAKQLMAKLGVEKVYKAGSYWFKSRDDAESWAKQQRCEVEEYGGTEK